MGEGSNADLSKLRGAEELAKLDEVEVLDLEDILTQFKAAINDLNKRLEVVELRHAIQQ